jgi:hypothetical protein
MNNRFSVLFKLLLILCLAFSYSLAQKELIQVIDITTDFPNSAGGVNLNISWKNVSKKTIKYITFDVYAYNRVDDKVSDEVSGDLDMLCKLVGPYIPGAEDNSSWDNVWYNNTIVRAEVCGVIITWMDNTTQYLNKKQYKVPKKK